MVRMFILIQLLFSLIFTSYSFAASPLAPPNGNATTCSETKAVYRPHEAYKKRDVDFSMTIAEPPQGKKTTERWLDYIFHASKNGEEVSSITMSLICGNGNAGCYIGGLSFIELNGDFSIARGDSAPYAYVFSNTQELKLQDKVESGLRFYTEEKITPEFKGLALWILSDCNK